jgi:hypothetical protein
LCRNNLFRYIWINNSTVLINCANYGFYFEKQNHFEWLQLCSFQLKNKFVGSVSTTTTLKETNYCKLNWKSVTLSSKKVTSQQMKVNEKCILTWRLQKHQMTLWTRKKFKPKKKNNLPSFVFVYVSVSSFVCLDVYLPVRFLY